MLFSKYQGGQEVPLNLSAILRLRIFLVPLACLRLSELSFFPHIHILYHHLQTYMPSLLCYLAQVRRSAEASTSPEVINATVLAFAFVFRLVSSEIFIGAALIPIAQNHHVKDASLGVNFNPKTATELHRTTSRYSQVLPRRMICRLVTTNSCYGPLRPIYYRLAFFRSEMVAVEAFLISFGTSLSASLTSVPPLSILSFLSCFCELLFFFFLFAAWPLP